MGYRFRKVKREIFLYITPRSSHLEKSSTSTSSLSLHLTQLNNHFHLHTYLSLLTNTTILSSSFYSSSYLILSYLNSPRLPSTPSALTLSTFYPDLYANPFILVLPLYLIFIFNPSLYTYSCSLTDHQPFVSPIFLSFTTILFLLILSLIICHNCNFTSCWILQRFHLLYIFYTIFGQTF